LNFVLKLGWIAPSKKRKPKTETHPHCGLIERAQSESTKSKAEKAKKKRSKKKVMKMAIIRTTRREDKKARKEKKDFWRMLRFKRAKWARENPEKHEAAMKKRVDEYLKKLEIEKLKAADVESADQENELLKHDSMENNFVKLTVDS